MPRASPPISICRASTARRLQAQRRGGLRRRGRSVASAGDVNGDGFADVIVGAYQADANGILNSGASYVVFSRLPDTAVNRTGTDAAQTLAGGDFADTLSGLGGDDRPARQRRQRHARRRRRQRHDDRRPRQRHLRRRQRERHRHRGGERGHRRGADRAGELHPCGLPDVENLTGTAAHGQTLTGNGGANTITGGIGNDTLTGGGGDDTAVFSGALADYAIGANDRRRPTRASPSPICAAARPTVTDTDDRGRDPSSSPIRCSLPPQFSANIDLSSLDGANGFKLSGAAVNDFSGRSVAAAGDVNGDGFADLIVGAYATRRQRSGASYVVFGQASGFAANIDLSASTAPTASSSAARRRATTAASRSPRPATSTATASPT